MTASAMFTMNSLTKFYALALSSVSTVIATTPATAANLGLFEVSSSGQGVTNTEQQISRSSNVDFTDFDSVTNLFSTSPATISDGNTARRSPSNDGDMFTTVVNNEPIPVIKFY